MAPRISCLSVLEKGELNLQSKKPPSHPLHHQWYPEKTSLLPVSEGKRGDSQSDGTPTIPIPPHRRRPGGHFFSNLFFSSSEIVQFLKGLKRLKHCHRPPNR